MKRFFLFAVLILASCALLSAAQQGEAQAQEPLTVAAAIAIAIAIVQFIKEKLIPSIWDKLGDAGKFIVAVLASLGVTLYKYLILEHLALNLSALIFCVEVVIGATVGYQVLKGVAPTLSRTIARKS